MAVTPPASDLVLPRSASMSTSTRRAGNGQGRERQCLTASHFDPEPMRGSLAGMPAGISGGQRITSARSCSTIGAMPWPHAMNSAIYARATLQALTLNSRKTTNLRRTSPARLVLHRQKRGHQQSLPFLRFWTDDKDISNGRHPTRDAVAYIRERMAQGPGGASGVYKLFARGRRVSALAQRVCQTPWDLPCDSFIRAAGGPRSPLASSGADPQCAARSSEPRIASRRTCFRARCR